MKFSVLFLVLFSFIFVAPVSADLISPLPEGFKSNKAPKPQPKTTIKTKHVAIRRKEAPTSEDFDITRF